MSGKAKRKMTLGMIVGNRGFFPDHLARTGHQEMKAVLEAGGSSLVRVAKVTIYMADLAELMAMNEVFHEYFPKEPPARTTFQAAGLVAGARVEIEAIAFA